MTDYKDRFIVEHFKSFLFKDATRDELLHILESLTGFDADEIKYYTIDDTNEQLARKIIYTMEVLP